MPAHRVGDLEIEEDLTFERRSWRFQRVGFSALGMFIFISMLGFTGSGPLSHATGRSSDEDLIVGYERFERVQSPSSLEIEFSPGLVQSREVQLWIESAYVRRVRIEQLTPEPESVDIDAGRYIFTFKVSADSSPAAIAVQLRPEEAGVLSFEIGIVDGPSLSLRQIVFP
jgi:hypothetical protein